MKTLKLSILLLATSFLVGCAAWRNGAPPTKTESSFFNVQTNYAPVVITVTNTPVVGQPPVVTQQTNQEAHYTYTPGPGIGAVKDAAGLVPGYGGLAGTGIGVLAALWAWFRSSKAKNTGVDLAQSIETIREFVKQLPNGGIYDSALTTWLSQHQADTGTVANVLDILSNDVSNSDAKVAADQIRAAILALNPAALPPKPPGV
jgi:hypothetical protein